MTKMTGIIVGVAHFLGNPYNGNTLDDTLNSIKSTTGHLSTTVFAGRGSRGREAVQGVKISPPSSPSKTTAEGKKLARKNFGRRSAIEPVIGHLKSDFRRARNHLKEAVGDILNLILAATAFNLRKWMRALPLCLFLRLQGLFAEFSLNVNLPAVWSQGNVFFRDDWLMTLLLPQRYKKIRITTSREEILCTF